MQNWLIIVIAVVGFLVVMLIIFRKLCKIFFVKIFLVSDCILLRSWLQLSSLVRPMLLLLQTRRRSRSRLQSYGSTSQPIFPIWRECLILFEFKKVFKEGEKKYPLPDAYSGQANTVRNPAVWYDMPTNDFGLVKSGQPQGTILTTGKASWTFLSNLLGKIILKMRNSRKASKKHQQTNTVQHWDL